MPDQAGELWLIRHGATDWSRSGQHTSRTDLALTEFGREQVQQLAPRLASLAPARVFCSPRRRAIETCELVGWGTAMVIDEDLCEWDYGEYEGLTTATIRERQSDWSLFEHGCPAGESIDAVARRADRFIARVRALGGVVAAFSHGHMLRVLAMRWCRLPAIEARRLVLDTATISLLAYDHGHRDEPVIRRWNVSGKS
jgi:probable phosphoglycerate mutase